MDRKPVSQSLDDERPRPDSPDQPTYQNHLARYEFALQWIQPHHRVAETACGTGYGAHLIAGKARSVLATDYSQLAIDYAREHFQASNLEYRVMDCARFDMPLETFDSMISFEVFEHLSDQRRYLEDCARCLRAGGLLLLSTPNRVTADLHMSSIGQTNPFHIGLVDLKDFKQMLGLVFSRFQIYGQRRRGNWVYSTLRSLDVMNLRLRLLRPHRRESLQQQFGVAAGARVNSREWVFTRLQLQQCNNFVAACWKNS